MSIKALQEYTFYSRYAKYRADKKRRETWKETISRVFDMHRLKYENQLIQFPELEEYISFAQKMVEKKMVLGSQRAMQFGGEAILTKNERIYNCASGYIDRPRAFQEAHYLLLCGTGVGFSCQKHHIAKLPKIASHTKNKKIYKIPDSIEGWADSIGVLLSSYFVKDQPFPEYVGHSIEFDYSLIRPKGAFISWGGLAPGPDGLKKSHEKIHQLIELRLSQGETRLRPIDCYDIIMHISDSVLSGGIRRCLPEYYQVKLSDGSYKKISDIDITTDYVQYAGKEYKITNVFDNGQQRLIKFDCGEQGYHVSSEYHKWLVYDKLENTMKWETAINIKDDPTRYAFVKDKDS